MKISKNVNPNFSDEASDYLEENGYSRSEGVIINGAIYFFKDNKGVVIHGDNADFMEYKDGIKSEYKRTIAFTGISKLDTFSWILLFAITDIVPLKTFVENVRKSDAYLVEKFQSLINPLN